MLISSHPCNRKFSFCESFFLLSACFFPDSMVLIRCLYQVLLLTSLWSYPRWCRLVSNFSKLTPAGLYLDRPIVEDTLPLVCSQHNGLYAAWNAWVEALVVSSCCVLCQNASSSCRCLVNSGYRALDCHTGGTGCEVVGGCSAKEKRQENSAPK